MTKQEKNILHLAMGNGFTFTKDSTDRLCLLRLVSDNILTITKKRGDKHYTARLKSYQPESKEKSLKFFEAVNLLY